MKIDIREASSKDLDFLRPLFEEGVSGGHFLGTPGTPVDRMLWEWLTRKVMVRQAVRRDGPHIEAIPINPQIAELDGVSAGFLMSSPETPEDRASIEMYMLVVAKSARRQGIASALIEYEEHQYPTGTSFCARCYKKSTWAIDLFQKLGYRIESVSPNTGMHYLRKP